MSKQDLLRSKLGNRTTGSTPAQETNNLIYSDGGDGQADVPVLKIAEKVKLDVTDIDKILPDPKQPRRVIPSTVRPNRIYAPEEIPAIFQHWFELYAEATGEHFDLDGYLSKPPEGDPEGDEITEFLGIVESLVALVRLAASIKYRGLTNGITAAKIVGAPGFFRIETGERRWLAHHLLRLADPDNTAWNTIPVKVEPNPSVWRQADENNVRYSLNAIAKAREFALLLMDIYGEANFKTYEEMFAETNTDRSFYAQVSDGRTYPIPYGRGEDVARAMDAKKSGQLRLYRALLRLPDEAWDIADDYSVPESRLRDLMSDDLADATKIEMVWGMRHGSIPSLLEDDAGSAIGESIPNSAGEPVAPESLQSKPPLGKKHNHNGSVDYQKLADRMIRKYNKMFETIPTNEHRLQVIRRMKEALTELEEKYTG